MELGLQWEGLGIPAGQIRPWGEEELVGCPAQVR